MIRFAPFRSPARKPLRLRRFALPSLLLGGVILLGANAVQGERGIIALFALETERQAYSQKLKALQDTNTKLQRDILLLSEPQPDLDFLDERARLILGFTAPDDAILLLQ